MIELKLKFNVPELTASRIYHEHRDMICEMISEILSSYNYMNVPKIATIYTDAGIENIIINGTYYEYSPVNFIDIKDISTYNHEVYFAESISLPVNIDDVIGCYIPNLYDRYEDVIIPLIINYDKDNSNNYLLSVWLMPPRFKNSEN